MRKLDSIGKLGWSIFEKGRPNQAAVSILGVHLRPWLRLQHNGAQETATLMIAAVARDHPAWFWKGVGAVRGEAWALLGRRQGLRDFKLRWGHLPSRLVADAES
jgi:hypothetical protein